MKVELKDAKVELEIGEGNPSLHINGRNIPIPREVGVALIFGEEGGKKPTVTTPVLPPTKPGLAKTKPMVRGCQTAKSKKRLSESLLKFHAKRRRKEAAELKKAGPIKVVAKSKMNGKSHLNGAATHHVN